MLHLFAGEPEAFGEVQPHVAVSAAFHLFLGQVAQNGTAQGTVSKTGVQGTEKGWEGGDVMKVFDGVGAQMLARKLACTPGLVKGMSEEVVAGDPLHRARLETGGS